MLIRTIAMAVLAVIVASYGYSLYRNGVISSWLAPHPQAKAIVFDNGSVRGAQGAAVSEPGQLDALSPPGAMRKCVRGDRVTYSNLTCPPGFKERQVATDGLTIIPTDGPKPPEVASRVEGAQKTLQSALDLRPDDRLRQKMIDRAVEAEPR